MDAPTDGPGDRNNVTRTVIDRPAPLDLITGSAAVDGGAVYAVAAGSSGLGRGRVGAGPLGGLR